MSGSKKFDEKEYQKKVEYWRKKSGFPQIKKNDSKSSIDMTEFLEKAGHFAIHHYGKEIGEMIFKILGLK